MKRIAAWVLYATIPVALFLQFRHVSLVWQFVFACLAVLPIAAWIGRSRSSGDPADDFLMKNAARILPVTRFTPGNTVIDVSDADALHRVAERLDTLVLHRAGPDDHVFAVQDVETTYRFVLPIEPDPATTRLAPVRLDETARLRPIRRDEETARLRPLRSRGPVPPPRRPSHRPA